MPAGYPCLPARVPCPGGDHMQYSKCSITSRWEEKLDYLLADSPNIAKFPGGPHEL